MSADNGVYILKTGKQYRVAHLRAIDNLNYDCDGHYHDYFVSSSVLSMFGNCKYTYDANQAIGIACAIKDTLSMCEYGIVVLDAHKTWKQILNEAKEEVTG